MHTRILNMMLSNNCHVREVDDPPGASEYTFDLHCEKVTIIAVCLTPGPWDETTIPEYRIISYKFETN